MATPTLFDLIYRAPKIIVSFGEEDQQNVKYLICNILNEPIIKGLARWARVIRQDARVVAFYRIENKASGNLVFKTDFAVKIKTKPGMSEEKATIPPDLLPASFLIAVVDKQDGKVYVANGRGAEKQTLVIGEYTVKVELLINGVNPKKDKCSFIVNDDYPFAYWDTNS
jgi:hypothetical protein